MIAATINTSHKMAVSQNSLALCFKSKCLSNNIILPNIRTAYHLLEIMKYQAEKRMNTSDWFIA